MTKTAPISTLRGHLCSYDHAARVAGAMAGAGLDVAIVSTLDPLQPWRVVEMLGDTPEPRILECA
jgi:hypothetical protein